MIKKRLSSNLINFFHHENNKDEAGKEKKPGTRLEITRAPIRRLSQNVGAQSNLFPIKKMSSNHVNLEGISRGRKNKDNNRKLLRAKTRKQSDVPEQNLEIDIESDRKLLSENSKKKIDNRLIIKRGRSARSIRKKRFKKIAVKRSPSASKKTELLEKWKSVKEKIASHEIKTPLQTGLVSFGSLGRDWLEKQNEVGDLSGVLYNRRSEAIDCLLFLPNCTFVEIWSLVVILLLLYTAFVMPYKLAFLETGANEWFWIDLFVDCLFLSDILININTAYYSDKRVRKMRISQRINYH